MLYMLHLCILKWKIKSLLYWNRSCGLLKFFPMEAKDLQQSVESFLLFCPSLESLKLIPQSPAGAAARLGYFCIYCMIIGARKRNHHLNMRAHFEIFMQTFLVPTVVVVFVPLTSK